MDPNYAYLPIHSYASAGAGCYSSSILDQQTPTGHLHQQPATKQTSAKTGKNSHGPVRGGKRRAEGKKDRLPYSSAGTYQVHVHNNVGSSSTGSPQLPAQVQRRNERERNRVRQLNSGFATLREHVPGGPKNKKMSKVETLRSALEHIARMKAILAGEDPDMCVDYHISSSSTTGSSAGGGPTSVDAVESPASCEPEQEFGHGESYGDYNGYIFDESPVSSTDFIKSEEDFPWVI